MKIEGNNNKKDSFFDKIKEVYQDKTYRWMFYAVPFMLIVTIVQFIINY